MPAFKNPYPLFSRLRSVIFLTCLLLVGLTGRAYAEQDSIPVRVTGAASLVNGQPEAAFSFTLSGQANVRLRKQLLLGDDTVLTLTSPPLAYKPGVYPVSFTSPLFTDTLYINKTFGQVPRLPAGRYTCSFGIIDPASGRSGEARTTCRVAYPLPYRRVSDTLLLDTTSRVPGSTYLLLLYKIDPVKKVLQPLNTDTIRGNCCLPGEQKAYLSKKGLYYYSIVETLDGYELASTGKTYVSRKKGKLVCDSSVADLSSTASSYLNDLDLLDLSISTHAFSRLKLRPYTRGTADITYCYSNVTHTNQLRKNHYAALTLSPTFSVAGIPLQSRVVLSTEQSAIYPVNSFSVGFNAKEYAAKQAEIKKANAEKLKESIQVKKKGLQYLEGKQKELENEKKSLLANDSLLAAGMQRLKDSAAARSRMMRDTLPGTDSLYNDSLLVKYRQDSAQLAYEMEAGRERLNTVLALADKVKSRYGQVKNLLQTDVEQLAKDSLSPDTGKYLSRIKGMLPAIKSLQAGLVNPVLSDFTIAGLPLRGAGVETEGERVSVSLFLGRTRRNFNPADLNRKYNGKFDRNALVSRVLLGQKNRNFVAFGFLYFSDPRSVIEYDHKVLLPAHNEVFLLQGQYTLGKKLKAGFETDLSGTGYHSSAGPAESTGIHAYGPSKNMAYQLTADYALSGLTSLKVKYKNLGSGYQSFGAPFLRNDLREYEVRLSQQFFGRQLSAEAFYRENRDNLSGMKSFNTTLRGYGLLAKSSFKKLPNFVFSYSPFEVNSHITPQAEYQGLQGAFANRLAVIQASAFHHFRLRKTVNVVTFTYVNNYIQADSSPLQKNETCLLTWVATLASSNTLSLNGGYIRTRPGADTLSSCFAGVEYGFGYKRHQFAVGSVYQALNKQTWKYGGTFAYRIRLGWIEPTRSVEYYRLHGNWNYGWPYELNIMAGARYSW